MQRLNLKDGECDGRGRFGDLGSDVGLGAKVDGIAIGGCRGPISSESERLMTDCTPSSILTLVVAGVVIIQDEDRLGVSS